MTHFFNIKSLLNSCDFYFCCKYVFLRRLYRHLDTETSSNRRDVGSVHESLATMDTAARSIEERINRFQTYMNGIERQAGTMMLVSYIRIVVLQLLCLNSRR